MKVLSIIHYAFFGGPHNRNTLLSPALKNIGVNTIVLLPDEEGNAFEIMRSKGVNVSRMSLHRLRSTFSLKVHINFFLSFLKEVQNLKKYIIHNQIDVVLINGLANPHGAIAAKLAGVPIVWQILDTRTPKVLSFFMMLLARSFSSVIMSTGVKVARMHPFTNGLNEKLVSFYPPVDTNKFVFDKANRKKIRKELNIPEDGFIIATVGNLNAQKGHEFFIQAAKIVDNFAQKNNIKVYFFIFGTTIPTHEAYLNQLEFLRKDLKFSDSDSFRIMSPQSEIQEILSSFDIFIQASVPNSEGIPTAILEAISCGLPIVSSDVGSISEVVENNNNGILVNSMDFSSMAEAIITLINDPEKLESMANYSINKIKPRLGIVPCAQAHKKSFELAMKN
ncbi:MAG: glycosyltransferase [Flavobacteriaceae bacterium]|jgi:glycosyltransferase involved in cell wall biosynthesis|nr:glycosyltransferase [Flavobacteriaceae bacterium]